MAPTSIIITIDGPAGTGKSTVSRELANRLGLEFLDTGAMYRAVAAIALDRDIPLDDAEGVAGAALEADLHFDWSQDPPAMMAFWKPVDDRLRDLDVNEAVSPVASIPQVRDVLVRRQRIIGQQHPRLVTEGRDQGSVVFPKAEVKFYLDASPQVRARRRVDQLEDMGLALVFEDVLQEIEERDARDATRKVGPLICPEDATRIDTSSMRFDEVVDTLYDMVQAHLARACRSQGCTL
ncbi:MAG: (d)CMP kinase [Planctomycetota bacterium]|jgi:cytidylate kinase